MPKLSADNKKHSGKASIPSRVECYFWDRLAWIWIWVDGISRYGCLPVILVTTWISSRKGSQVSTTKMTDGETPLVISEPGPPETSNGGMPPILSENGGFPTLGRLPFGTDYIVKTPGISHEKVWMAILQLWYLEKHPNPFFSTVIFQRKEIYTFCSPKDGCFLKKVAQLKNTAVFITQISSGCKISGLRSIGPNSLGGLGAEKEAIGWGKKCQVSPKNGMDGWILPSFDKKPKSLVFESHGKKVSHGHHVIPLLFDQPSSPGPKTPQRSEVSWRCHTYSCH